MTKLGSRRRTDERGFVVVWMAAVTVLLIAVAALAVDLVHAYAEAQHLQNAVDAAALAGAVEIPTDTTGGHAATRAGQVVDQHFNGTNFATLPGNALTATIDSHFSNQMNVDAKEKIDTFFAKAIGFRSLTLHKTAQAQYDPPIQMGSPANYVGVVPECPNGAAASTCENILPLVTDTGLFPSIEGSDAAKRNGNAITTGACDNTITDGCAAATVGAANADHNSNGEDFLIHNDVTGPVEIWIYDPSYVRTGNDCKFENPLLDTWPGNVNTNYDDATAPSPEPNAYCAGDFPSNSALIPLPTPAQQVSSTTFALYDPAHMTTPIGGCSSPSFPGFLSPHAAYGFDQTNTSVYFHKWYKLCTPTLPVTADGDEYVLRVNTSGGLTVNDFTILATHGGASTGRLGVFARSVLPITTRARTPGAHPFFLARVLPSSQPRTLSLNFFDLGDSTKGVKTGTLDVGLYNATGTLTCKSTQLVPKAQGGRSSPVPPSPPGVPFTDGELSQGGCTGIPYDADPNDAKNNDGRWMGMKITLPAQGQGGGYTCTTTGAGNVNQNCWLTIMMTPTPINPCPSPCYDGWINDITTWNAYLGGAPARLVG